MEADISWQCQLMKATMSVDVSSSEARLYTLNEQFMACISWYSATQQAANTGRYKVKLSQYKPDASFLPVDTRHVQLS